MAAYPVTYHREEDCHNEGWQRWPLGQNVQLCLCLHLRASYTQREHACVAVPLIVSLVEHALLLLLLSTRQSINYLDEVQQRP